MKTRIRRNPRNTIRGRKRVKNSAADAKAMAEAFHGRDIDEIVEVEELDKDPNNYAEIGKLMELIVRPLDSEYEWPISFADYKETSRGKWECVTPRKDVIIVATDAKGKQIYFISGNQNIENVISAMDEDNNAEESRHRYALLGLCEAISYYTDKHHLEGPEYQKTGCPYEHQFGEQGGIPPMLVYDRLNERLMLVGGSYEVRDVGIWN